MKSRTGLKKNCFRRKWETKERTWRPHGRFKEPLYLRHWNIKNWKREPKKKSECVWNKVKEWQWEKILPPCHPKTYIRNINSIMRMTRWMTRGLMSVKTLKGVKSEETFIRGSYNRLLRCWDVEIIFVFFSCLHFKKNPLAFIRPVASVLFTFSHFPIYNKVMNI